MTQIEQSDGSMSAHFPQAAVCLSMAVGQGVSDCHTFRMMSLRQAGWSVHLPRSAEVVSRLEKAAFERSLAKKIPLLTNF